MKVKLYKKFIKFICKKFKISKQQLFSRDFNEHIMPCYGIDINSKNVYKDGSHLRVFSHKSPLSQTFKALCLHEIWLFKYWKHSHWKKYIQIQIDLGLSSDDIIKNILKNEFTKHI